MPRSHTAFRFESGPSEEKGQPLGSYLPSDGAMLGPSSCPRPRLVLGGPGRRRGECGNASGGGGGREVRAGAVGRGDSGAVSVRRRWQVRAESVGHRTDR